MILSPALTCLNPLTLALISVSLQNFILAPVIRRCKASEENGACAVENLSTRLHETHTPLCACAALWHRPPHITETNEKSCGWIDSATNVTKSQWWEKSDVREKKTIEYFIFCFDLYMMLINFELTSMILWFHVTRCNIRAPSVFMLFHCIYGTYIAKVFIQHCFYGSIG